MKSHLKKTALSIAVCAAAMSFAGGALAQAKGAPATSEFVTKDEAIAMVQKGIDGKPFVKERVELAQSKGTFWQDYKFSNPVSKKIEPKQMYCERLDDTAVCGGIYKN